MHKYYVHPTALWTSPDANFSPIYLAVEADEVMAGASIALNNAKARIRVLQAALKRAEELFQDECDPVSEPDSYAWLQETRSLMGS